jgi:predicted unusual protein kinase regulating ubiquinone biosynthesis (AarF/ABC1/UbiB family)
MSRFPFRLPKNLALYMRMSSILEGIYYHHKVSFQFVKVLAGLLEEEGLVRDAYIEEVKVTAKRFAKGIQDSVNVAPLLKTYLETMGPRGGYEKNNSALVTSIFASALFIGSALMLPHNFYLAYGGFAASAAAVVVALKKKI